MEKLNGRFEILEEVGRGRQGRTFKAKDHQTDQEVALKQLHMGDVEDWKSVELFERETRVLKSIEHPNVPDFVDAFASGEGAQSKLCIVQEFIEGQTLDQRLKSKGRWEADEAKEALEALLQVLDDLHRRVPPVVHRDIKPGNIIQTPQGKLVLIDFGAVQDQVQGTVGGSTVIGTPGYMPMEQMIGRAVPASDLYSLGVTFAFLLTGVSPTDAPLVKNALDYGPLLSKEDPHLARVITRMIAPNVEERFESARDVLKALRQPQSQPPASPNDAPAPTSTPPQTSTSPQAIIDWDALARSELAAHYLKVDFYQLPPTGPPAPYHQAPLNGWTRFGGVATHRNIVWEKAQYWRSPDGTTIFESFKGLKDTGNPTHRLITFFEDGTSIATGERLKEHEGKHQVRPLIDTSHDTALLIREHQFMVNAALAQGKRPIDNRLIDPQRAYLWTRAIHHAQNTDLFGRRLGAEIAAFWILAGWMIVPFFYMLYIWWSRIKLHKAGIHPRRGIQLESPAALQNAVSSSGLTLPSSNTTQAVQERAAQHTTAK